MSMKSIFLCCVALGAFALLGWRTTSSSAYESADYTVQESDSPFEIRAYPDLMLAATQMRSESRRDSGSFMRLFRYISGANDNQQKLAMTTPVFTEFERESSEGQMGFVLPKKVAAGRVPKPSDGQVEINKREGGSFAVIRFNGRMNNQLVAEAAESLRGWMKEKGYVGEDVIEIAGYDPPWIPGPMRRNEVLIRLKPAEERAAELRDLP